jgi:Fanconi-associated nuclease 1
LSAQSLVERVFHDFFKRNLFRSANLKPLRTSLPWFFIQNFEWTMSKRKTTIASMGKENKRKKSFPQDSQRKLESFFGKRSIASQSISNTCVSPNDSSDCTLVDSKGDIEVSDDTDNPSELTLSGTCTPANLDDTMESQSSVSVLGSSTVDAESTDEIQPFFATSMYTDEFEKIMETVLDGEKYLFTEEELAIAQKHHTLHNEAKHLFVRIFLRKHKWIRLQKTDYSRNIADINRAKEILCCPEVKFARDENDLVVLKDLLNMLLVEELKELIQGLRIPTVKASQQSVSFYRALCVTELNCL